jgi:hypothetical protein
MLDQECRQERIPVNLKNPTGVKEYNRILASIFASQTVSPFIDENLS